MSKNETNGWNTSDFVVAWKEKAAERNKMLGEATRRMLQFADVKKGSKVLDIAAGSGDQTLIAAEMVGDTGSVIATDISDQMLNVALELAKEEGFRNVSTQVMDARELNFYDHTFDSVISRHGLMFVPNVKQAFEEIYRVLKKGGKVGALVWSNPEKNPGISIPMGVLFRLANLEPPKADSPGVFSLSDPVYIKNLLETIGFQEVSVTPVKHTQTAKSALEFIQGLKETASGALGGANNKLDQNILLQIQKEIYEKLKMFEGEGGFKITSESLLIAGTKK